jgi:hypothetical protein
VCKSCGNFQPCQCEEAADHKTVCVNCGAVLYVPAWAMRGYLVTCYDHRNVDSVIGVHTPTEVYRQPTPDDITWNNDPLTNWGTF